MRCFHREMEGKSLCVNISMTVVCIFFGCFFVLCYHIILIIYDAFLDLAVHTQYFYARVHVSAPCYFMVVHMILS